MEIIRRLSFGFLLRFIVWFLLFLALWSLVSSSYSWFKMQTLQQILSWIYPTQTPFIRNPGFLQGFAISELTLLSLIFARWNKVDLSSIKKYPWTKVLGCIAILFIINIASQLMEVISQRSSTFFLNYAVTWLLSVGVIVLPFLCWVWLESTLKPA